MRQVLHRLTIETRGNGLTDVTRPVLEWTATQGIETGLLTTMHCAKGRKSLRAAFGRG